MGDTGSMFLGFVLATSSIQTNQKASTTVAVLIPIITLGLPILDTLLAMSRRAVRGRPLFRADKEHIHHRLLASGSPTVRPSWCSTGMCVLLGAVALVLTYTNSAVITVTLLAVLAGSLFVFLRRLGYIRFELNHLLSDQRRRNRALRAAVRPFADRLRGAADQDEIWDVVRRSFRSSRRASSASSWAAPMAIVATAKAGRRFVFSTSPAIGQDETTPTGSFRARFSLVGIRRDEGHVELGWSDARDEARSRHRDRDRALLRLHRRCVREDPTAPACSRRPSSAPGQAEQPRPSPELRPLAASGSVRPLAGQAVGRSGRWPVRPLGLRWWDRRRTGVAVPRVLPIVVVVVAVARVREVDLVHDDARAGGTWRRSAGAGRGPPLRASCSRP